LSTNSANVPPTATITAPTNNARYYSPASITINAGASDIDGVIGKVAFYQGATKLGEDTSSPHSFTWTGVGTGTYNLTAVATDNNGATNGSASVSVSVIANTAPTISITSPTNESSFSVPGTIPIQVQAQDAEGFIQKVEFFRDGTKIGESANSPFTFYWTNATPGFYSITARATDDAGSMADSAPVTVFVNAAGGSLSATVSTPALTTDLSSEGTVDWVHWGLFTETSVDRKTGVAPQISDYVLLGVSNTVYPYFDNPTGYAWTDGTPTLSVSNTITGIYFIGLSNGFSLTAPADTATRTLRIYVGAYGARGKFMSYLSDLSGSVFVDSSIDNYGNGPGAVYAITYSAASSNKFLNVRFFASALYDNSFGNVTLQAASLSGGNLPPTAMMTSPANNSACFGPTNLLLSASASDPDGSISKIEFFNGTNLIGQVTNGFAFTWSNVPLGDYTLTARATDNCGATFTSPPNSVFVGIPGGQLQTQFGSPAGTNNLSSEGTTDWIHWGYTDSPNGNPTINKLDDAFTRKSPTANKISNITMIGLLKPIRDQDGLRRYVWNDGTPFPSANTRMDIYVTNLGNGFQITAPASTNLMRLRVYTGVYGARGKFQASLSDFSSPSFIDNSLNNGGATTPRVYTIDFAAASTNKTLTVRFTTSVLYDLAYGNVAIHAATLVPLHFCRLLGSVKNGAGFSSSFVSDPGVTYSLEGTPSLSPASWQVLQSVVGNGSTLWLSDSNASLFSNRFYRVRVQ
jgi:hypothetical protein